MFATLFAAPSPGGNGGLYPVFILGIFLWLLVVAILNLTTAMLLLRKRKPDKAIVMSLVALLLMIPTFGMTISYVASVIGSANDNLTLAGFLSGTLVTAFMIGLTAVGHIKTPRQQA